MNTPTNWKSIAIWSIFILALVGMLVGLAQLGTKGTGGANPVLATPVSTADWSKGNPNAPHTLVEYSDFQCPACAEYYPIVKQLTEELGDRVHFVYRSFPLRSIHENAQIAAQAAEAAGKQGKFWEMHDVLFNTQETWANNAQAENLFADYAKSIGLDVAAFQRDLASSDVKKRVNDSYDSGTASGITGTPSFFLDGQFIQTPGSYDELKKLIQ